MYVWSQIRKIGIPLHTQVFLYKMGFKDDTDPKGDFNDSIKFSYSYFEATLECFICTEQVKN